MKLRLEFDLEELRILHNMVMASSNENQRAMAFCSESVKESMTHRKMGDMLRPMFKHDQAEISEKITRKNEHHFREWHLGLTDDREVIERIHKKVEKAFDEIYRVLNTPLPTPKREPMEEA